MHIVIIVLIIYMSVVIRGSGSNTSDLGLVSLCVLLLQEGEIFPGGVVTERFRVDPCGLVLGVGLDDKASGEVE